MTNVVELRVEFDEDDWLRGDIWRADGVLAAFIDLRVRKRRILHNHPAGMNNSAIALVRSGYRSHEAVSDGAAALRAKWPLFFCAAALPNRCGVIRDFSVSHDGSHVHLSAFYGCDVPPSTELTIPRMTWASAMLTLGSQVLRRCPPRKQGIKRTKLRQYLSYRARLAAELARLRASLRASGA